MDLENNEGQMPVTPRAGLSSIGFKGPKYLFLQRLRNFDITSRSLEVDSDDSHCVPIVMESPKLMPQRREQTSAAASLESIMSSYDQSSQPLQLQSYDLSLPTSPLSGVADVHSPPFEEHYNDNSSYSDDWDSTISLNSPPHLQYRYFQSFPSFSELPNVESTERLQFNFEDPEDSEGRSEVNLYTSMLHPQDFPTSSYQANLNVLSCAICLEDFCQGEIVKTLPCFHCFHDDHISTWLMQSQRCPLCKLRVVSM
jgi:hypothetical protein